MSISCIRCEQADLEPKKIQLLGQVRGETYSVEMLGLECPKCGYKTIEGSDMPEFGRLLADQYRKSHGLLTSEEIRERRKRLRLSQEEFANWLGVGVASVKRWEMGKIQDARHDKLIRENTDPLKFNTVPDHVWVDSTAFYVLGAGITIVSSNLESPGQTDWNLKTPWDELSYGCRSCKSTAWTFRTLPNQQVVPPRLPLAFTAYKEKGSRARKH